MIQTDLFIPVEELTRQPLMLAYGLGVDSTAVLVELEKRGIRPDAILFADTGDEKQETYDYLPIINAWLKQVGFPEVTVVKYEPQNFKNWPPYHSLGENCLTNGTLPSLAFGFKSCSLKWKVIPQNNWTDKYLPAVNWWNNGGKVKKMIGYDASAKDMKRYAHAKGIEDDKYEYWYPLIEWKMNREACKASIRSAGLPVPPKSACKFCPATQPEELHEHRLEYLRLIVIMEARAKPRLEGLMTEEQLKADYERRLQLWQQKLEALKEKKFATGGKLETALKKLHKSKPKLKKVGAGCSGLWRKGTKKRPAMMTDYILQNNLLPAAEIIKLQAKAPEEIIQNQIAFANGELIPSWHDFLEMFSEEDALDELPNDCIGCNIQH